MKSKDEGMKGWGGMIWRRKILDISVHLAFLLSYQNKQIVIFGNVFGELLHPPTNDTNLTEAGKALD